MSEQVKAICLDENDNVATVIHAVHKGDLVVWESASLEAQMNIPKFHKISIEEIEEGQIIRKYGQTIGVATERIPKGCHVHMHNCKGTAVEEVHT